MSGDDHVVTRIEFHMVVDGKTALMLFVRPEKIAELLFDENCSIGQWLRSLRSSASDRVVTRIEFRMVVDGKAVAAVFTRPEKIADLLSEERCSLGEWLRALRDAPEVPDVGS